MFVKSAVSDAENSVGLLKLFFGVGIIPCLFNLVYYVI